MIEQFVRTLLAPLYRLIGQCIPILLFIIILIGILYLVSNLKMHISRKGNGVEKESCVPYLTEEELENVFTGKEK